MSTLRISAYELSDTYEVRAYVNDELFTFECETYEQAIDIHKEMVRFSDYLVEFVRDKCQGGND